jgi:hypothetical protein
MRSLDRWIEKAFVPHPKPVSVDVLAFGAPWPRDDDDFIEAMRRAGYRVTPKGVYAWTTPEEQKRRREHVLKVKRGISLMTNYERHQRLCDAFTALLFAWLGDRDGE